MEAESDVVNVYIARKNFELNNVNSENSFDENLTELLTEDTCKELEIDLTKNDAICEASMKKLNRHVTVHVNRKTSAVEKASCTCQAGKSGYCNHVMALLYELADYSLQSLIKVPSETACTSQLRKWGIPGDKESKKEPVMKTSIVTQDHKRGIQPTLCEARLNFDINDNKLKVIEMKEKLSKIDKNIEYSHVIPSNMKFSDEFTKFGTQFIGSPLCYQLLPLEENFKFITNINKVDKYSVIILKKLQC